MNSPDVTKLEEAISMADISRDINLFLKKYLDNPKPLSEDEVSNYLMGLEYTARLRWENLWEVFCREFRLDHYSNSDLGVTLAGVAGQPIDLSKIDLDFDSMKGHIS